MMITGASYIGAPRSNTAMFITKKVESLLSALEPVENCLIFAEEGIEVPDELRKKHEFVFSAQPQLEYAKFANKFAEERNNKEKKLKLTLTPDGYYIFEDSVIGENCYIEPCCIIGPDAQIGKNARILAGTIIRRATIGDNFLANENAVIGANGFTMTKDADGNRIRIPTLGRVIIGDNVEVGAHDNISCGSGGNTILEDNVKVDALVHIAHDVHLHKNVEITGGATVSGFVDAKDNAYIGPGAILKNRISIGNEAFIGMGSCVMKSVKNNYKVAGNPAMRLDF